MDEGHAAAWKNSRLGLAGFILAIVVLVGATVSINVLTNDSTYYTGAAIDSEDASVLNPAEELVLQNYGAVVAWINLAGTALGLTALVIGIWTRKSSRFAPFTIIASLLAPVLCFIPSIWILSAAGNTQ